MLTVRTLGHLWIIGELPPFLKKDWMTATGNPDPVSSAIHLELLLLQWLTLSLFFIIVEMLLPEFSYLPLIPYVLSSMALAWFGLRYWSVARSFCFDLHALEVARSLTDEFPILIKDWTKDMTKESAEIYLRYLAKKVQTENTHLGALNRTYNSLLRLRVVEHGGYGRFFPKD